MALVHMEGFDGINAAGFVTTDAALWDTTPYICERYREDSTYALVSGRAGGQGLKLEQYTYTPGASVFVRHSYLGINLRQLGVSKTFTVGFAIKFGASIPVDMAALCRFDILRRDTDHPAAFRTNVAGSNAQLERIGSGYGVDGVRAYVPGDWAYVEIVHEVTEGADPLGSDDEVNVKMYLDDVLAYENTEELTSTRNYRNLANLTLYIEPTNAADERDLGIVIDDLYIRDDTARFGPVRVATRYPDADTAQDDWQKSEGSDAFSLVDDEEFDGDGTYIFGSDADDEVRMTASDGLGIVETVHAVAVRSSNKKTDGASRTLANVLKSGTTEVEGSEEDLETSYSSQLDIWVNNPDTAAAWTGAEALAVEFGVKVKS